MPARLLGGLLAVVASGSPAQAAVSGLVAGSHSGRAPVPLPPPAGAALPTAGRPRRRGPAHRQCRSP
ncbi:hypothetical protein [Streptomyces nogalater]|uniref:hypothetical protein n=1 Tax=Streptomyces nogalater TaxID=38314 RepID=UPI0031D3151D